MLTRPYGATGLKITALGFGAMQVGSPDCTEADAERILNGVLDLGITLIDTARSYGQAEDRIGRYLARRRGEFVLSTKVGYGVAGVADWTYECVALGIDAARDRLRTDVIDVVHLHSCPASVLDGSGVVDALCAAVGAGKIGVVGYSGDADALSRALDDPRVGAVEVSVNLCDQEALPQIAAARARGVGVLAKRPMAGLPWLAAKEPEDPPHAEYWRRFQLLAAPLGTPDWASLALRFAAFQLGVDACLVGGTNLANVAKNVATVARGPLPSEEGAAIRAAFAAAGESWRGVV